MKKESIVGERLQDAVRKLISEEYYAYKLYMLARLAVKADEKGAVDQLFSEISDDELNDHLKMLVEWCRDYGVDVPCSEAEFKKAADSKISKQVDYLKKNKDAAYYMQEGITSEEAALASYKKVLDMDEVHEFTDLQSALWKIYYDEEEHLRDLNTAKIAYDAGDNLVIG